MRHKRALTIAIATATLLATATPAEATTHTYFVDCASGSDSNAGTSSSSAWRTLAKINSVTLAGGDIVSFRAGTTCTGTFAPRGSGAAGHPITATSYGTGAKPRINGNGATAAILLDNVQGWHLTKLDVTNTGPAPGATQTRVGVYVRLTDYGIGEFYQLDELTVHDVNGCDCRYPNASGGIVFYAAGSATITGFDHVLVQHNTLTHVDHNGVAIVSDWERNANYPTGPGSGFGAVTGLNIAQNTLTDIGGDGITVFNGVSAFVQYNRIDGFSWRSGDYNTGAFAWNSTDIVFQFNEVTHGAANAPAFDLDGGDIRNIYQYNFTHDNQSGFIYLCPADNAASNGGIVRYNISQNDDRANVPGGGLVVAQCGDEPNTQFYNNVFYAPAVQKMVQNDAGATLSFRNNIFVGSATNSQFADSTGNYEYNHYQSIGTPPAHNAYVRSGDPMFVAPGQATDRLHADGYALKRGSPDLGTGVAIANNGNVDYFQNLIPTQSPNIGAYQGPGV
ncbi:MAG TPA: hypothetical protein VJX66_03985 [Amycolatopsis sp.]|nr:hypothetical protein [Amycolatopsis sp.]